MFFGKNAVWVGNLPENRAFEKRTALGGGKRELAVLESVCLLLRSGISVSRVQRQLSADAQEHNPTAIRSRRLRWNSRRWRRAGRPTKTAVSPNLCISNKRRARPRVGGIRLSGATRDGRAGLIRGPSASFPVNGGFATRNPRKLQRLCKVLKRPLL